MAKINIRESLGRLDLLTDNKYDLRNTYDSSNISNDKKKKLAESISNNASAKQIYNILNEDTVKQNGKWVNKGSEGTHGKFKTKKAADAQRKAMFANGYKGESLDEQINLPGYAVKYTTGYSGNGVNSSKTEWFRTEEERDRRVKELKDKNYIEIKTWKMDNFYHTLPENESLNNSKKVCVSWTTGEGPTGRETKCFDSREKANKFADMLKNKGIISFNVYDESLNEANYGGAYDIEDDMFWTKDDLIEFSDAVCEKLADKFGYQYDIADVGAENNNDMYITIMDTTHDIEADVSFRIKMSRIRSPRDLMKYLDTVVSQFVKKFEEEYQYYDFDESLNEDYRPLAIGYMTLKKEIPNHVNYAEFANYDEVVTAIPSEADVVIYPRGGKIGGTDIAYWQFDAIDGEGKKTKANFSTYIYLLKDYLNNDEMEFRLIPEFKLIDEYPYLIEVDDEDLDESLTEDVDASYTRAYRQSKKESKRFSDEVKKGKAWDEVLVKLGYECVDPNCTLWEKEVDGGNSIVFSFENFGEDISDSDIECYVVDKNGNVPIGFNSSIVRFNESLTKGKKSKNVMLKEDLDLSEVKEVKSIPFENKRVNNLRGLFSVKDFVDALNKVGLDKFKIRTSRLNNVSQADMNDSWMDLKRSGWSVYSTRDSSLKDFNHVYVFEKTINESLTEDVSKPDFVVGFYAGNVDDETLELINPQKLMDIDVSVSDIRKRFHNNVEMIFGNLTSDNAESKLKSDRYSLAKDAILTTARRKAIEHGLDSKFRKVERSLGGDVSMDMIIEEINYPFESGIKKLSKELGKKLLPNRGIKEGLQDIMSDFAFARKNWNKLGTGVSLDDALEEYNRQYGDGQFYARPIYVESEWNRMVNMFKDRKFWESMNEDVDTYDVDGGRLTIDRDNNYEVDFEETDFSDEEVEEGANFSEGGEDWTWEERIAGPIHIDFDNWSVWRAKKAVDIRDFIIGENDHGGYNIDEKAFYKAHKDSPRAYFVVDEDTGFIDWGPVESQTEAQDFLNGKIYDWEEETDYTHHSHYGLFGESLKKNKSKQLKESKYITDNGYSYTLYYDDVGGSGREYEYDISWDEMFDYLNTKTWENGEGPEELEDDEEKWSSWVKDNMDELISLYEDDILEYFEEDASQEEYDNRDPDDRGYDPYEEIGMSPYDFY